MLTILLVLAVVIGVAALVGGAAMMIDPKAGFMGWYMGHNAIKGGFVILAEIVPAILAAILDSK